MAQTNLRAFRRVFDELGVNAIQRRKVDKERISRANFYWFLDKTAQMFEYENLPATLPKYALERLLQLTGGAVVWRVPKSYRPRGFGISFIEPTPVDSIYAFELELVDAPDPYGDPYQALITNPGFEPTISETLEINKDCVVIRNDTNFQGLAGIHWKYAKLLTEAEISLQSTLILLRDQMTFICKSNRQKEAVDAYISAREAGEYAGILAPELGSPLEAIAHDGRSNAVELAVNGVQAIKSAWYNEIGLNPSFSLKREYTSAQEIDTNTDLLLPMIDDMLYNRQIGIDMVNKMFGTNITVERSSAWKVKEQEIDLAIKAEKMETQQSTQVDMEEGEDNVVVQPEQSDSGSE